MSFISIHTTTPLREVGINLKMCRLLAAAGKQKTYRCDTCNKTFTSQVRLIIPSSFAYYDNFPLFRLCSSSTLVCGGSRVVVSGGTCNSLEKQFFRIFHSILANNLHHIEPVNFFQFQVDAMWEDSWLRWWSLLTTNCCENLNSINWVFSKTCIWPQICGHWTGRH